MAYLPVFTDLPVPSPPFLFFFFCSCFPVDALRSKQLKAVDEAQEKVNREMRQLKARIKLMKDAVEVTRKALGAVAS